MPNPLPLAPAHHHAWWTRTVALRCWSVNCWDRQAETQDPRWRGKYCAPCLTALAADAERMEEGS